LTSEDEVKPIRRIGIIQDEGFSEKLTAKDRAVSHHDDDVVPGRVCSDATGRGAARSWKRKMKSDDDHPLVKLKLA
jgi:hypothetical protein